MEGSIKNLIEKWQNVLVNRESELDRWTGITTVADVLQEEIDVLLDVINDLEMLLYALQEEQKNI